MIPEHVARLFHTARHLRPAQFLYRAKYWLIRRPRIRTSVDVRACDDAHIAIRTSAPLGPVEYLGNGRLCFLNREGHPGQGWHPPGYDRLWLYNLHYFNYLHQRDRERCRDELAGLIDAWTHANPVGRGAGWEPYPLSLRIVNWVKWAGAGFPLDPQARRSLYLQARYLGKRLEYHLMGNHLFANAKALIHAGLFFRTPEADRWLRKGVRVMEREVSRQILADGGHAELSPMYHALFVEDLLDIVNLCTDYRDGRHSGTVARCLTCARAPLSAMLTWLRTMCHPDGEIALFNDAAFGIAKRCADLFDYARRLGVEVSAPSAAAPALAILESSGYVRAEQARYVALLDAARVGPDYQPGHGHADTLGFELSLAGERLIVDAGTSTYAMGPRRAYERGTAAHNTVVLGTHNSSDVWSAFRVGRRAYPRGLAVQPSPRIATDTSAAGERQGWTVSAAHTGYRHLRGIVHRRRWILDPDRVTIVDQLRGNGGKLGRLTEPACATLRFAPGLTVRAARDGTVEIASARGTACRIAHTAARIEILDDFYSPRFGISLSCKIVRLHFDGLDLTTQLSFDASP